MTKESSPHGRINLLDSILKDLTSNDQQPNRNQSESEDGQQHLDMVSSPEFQSLEYNRDQLYQLCFSHFELISATGGHCALGPLNIMSEDKSTPVDFKSIKSRIPLQF